MLLQESAHDGLVLLLEQAAGCVDQPAASLHQAGGGGQNGRLSGAQLGDACRRLPPLQGGVAAQGAEAGTGRVDQDAIELACQAPDLDVALGIDAYRMNVRQPGTRQAGFQACVLYTSDR